MNIEGQCLSVKDFMRNWSTENAYDNIYATTKLVDQQTRTIEQRVHMLRQLQDRRETQLENGSRFTKFSTGRVHLNDLEMLRVYAPILLLKENVSQPELKRISQAFEQYH